MGVTHIEEEDQYGYDPQDDIDNPVLPGEDTPSCEAKHYAERDAADKSQGDDKTLTANGLKGRRVENVDAKRLAV